ncbi:MAG: hypothetical protein HW416_1039 [Chloroflexi bacterium]|nr:hypothetical protein [Chloroflexota bacterium]
MGIRSLVRAAAWGIGVAGLAGAGLVYTRGGRPALKGAMVSYLALSDRMREIAGDTAERVRDAFEEAKVEYADTLAPGVSSEGARDGIRRSA